MNITLKKLEQFGIVPVVVLEDTKDAAPLAKALCDGGLACGSYFPDRCSRRVNPYYDKRVSGNGCWSGNSPDNRTG